MLMGLFGRPGGGKGYEAVVYHILVALEAGRKVITNMPLDVERFAAIDASYADLIELRFEPLTDRQVEPPAGGSAAARLAAKVSRSQMRVFGHPDDYVSDWRSQEGRGPLFVIDEAANCLPRLGTPRELIEWMEMHRHTNADVLLMSQTPGRITADVTDLMDVSYFCQKAAALGSMDRYIRKVRMGVKGEIVNTAVRDYKTEYFGLWKSHTKGQAVAELAPQDIVPLWKRWPFIGAALVLPLGVAVLVWGATHKKVSHHDQLHARAVAAAQAAAAASAASAPVAAVSSGSSGSPAAAKVAAAAASDPASQAAASTDAAEPFGGYGLHLLGCISNARARQCAYAVSQNGQIVSRINDADLVAAGYSVDPLFDCAARLHYRKTVRQVVCDAPQTAVALVNGKT